MEQIVTHKTIYRPSAAKEVKPFFSFGTSAAAAPFFQPKRTVNQPNDVYEKEADAIAEQVMKKPVTKDDSHQQPIQKIDTDTTLNTKLSPTMDVHMPTQAIQQPLLQKQEAVSEKQEQEGQMESREATVEKMMDSNPTAGFNQPAGPVQRMCAECHEEEEKVSRKEDGTNSSLNTSSVEQTISSPGQPLPADTRSFMEERLGHDFSHVQIHNDAKAHQSSADINAIAYTHQQHIAFGEGQYQPESDQGKKLLAHELVHVVQQAASNSVNEKSIQLKPGSKDSELKKRAATLKAADATSLIKAALPFVFGTITSSQIQQMQRVLDAAVVNPVIKKEADELYSRSSKRYGTLIVRDAKIDAQADRVMAGFSPISESDRSIKLDFKALLAPDALNTTTDNPDEAAYLATVKEVLADRGVWLRFSPRLVPDIQNPSAWVIDQRNIEVWLSLGWDGEHIPTKSGQIDRRALLNTTSIGAGYYRNVHMGVVNATLEKEISRLQGLIEAGIEQHILLAKIRDDAMFGVVEVTDFFGDAEFPERTIWNDADKLLLQGMTLHTNGNIKGAQAYLIAAAVLTRAAAKSLGDYIADSSSGGEKTVGILSVVKTAGEIAEVGLAVASGVGLVRGVASKAASAGVAEGASIDAAATKLLDGYVAKNPGIVEDLASVRYVTQPAGSIGGGVKPGSSSGGGVGFHKY